MNKRLLNRVKKYIFNNDRNVIKDFQEKRLDSLKFLYLDLINVKESNYNRLISIAIELQFYRTYFLISLIKIIYLKYIYKRLIMKLYIPSVYHLHTPKKTETRGLHPNFGLVYTLNFKQLLRYK